MIIRAFGFLCFACSLLLGMSPIASAVPITHATFSWDTDDMVSAVTIISETGNEINEFSSSWNSTPVTNWVPATHNTVGDLADFLNSSGGSSTAIDASVNIGTGTSTNQIELTWGGLQLTNLPGDDLVIYENAGGSGVTQEEVFAIAVRQVGQAGFTPFRFKKPAAFESFTTATGFDLSDFGLGPNIAIDAIRILNPEFNIDSVDNASGEGMVVFGTGPDGISNFQFQASDNAEFTDAGRFDPDITIVAGLHSVTAATASPLVPEPSSLLLISLGLLGLSARRGRKRSR